MGEFHPDGDPSLAMAELQSLLARLQAEGATDEEVPFIQEMIERVRKGDLSPADALHAARKKLQTRSGYH